MAAPAAASSSSTAGSDLSDEQASVIKRVLAGESIYLSGDAGTGKSYLLHALRATAGASAGFTAMTGIAATHINGQTLHSFLGIGDGTKSAYEIATKIMRMPYMKTQRENCTQTRVLVIDEISMCSAQLWELVIAVIRMVRKLVHGQLAFLVSGDFAQLPPVFKGATPLETQQMDKRLAFESPVWQRMFPPSQCVRLTKIFRQKDDKLLSLLSELRTGKLSGASKATVKECDRELPAVNGVVPTTLFSTRNEVEPFNHAELAKLPGEAEVHVAVDYVDPKADKFAFNTPEKIDKLFMAPRKLPLKVGAQLMLIVNDRDQGLVNGSRCTATELHKDDSVTVTFMSGRVLRMHPQPFSIKDRGGNVLVSRRQLPLILAWACTIHKSQGMSLDYVSMDLSKGFETGQVYVAVSRAKTLEGLHIKGGFIPAGRIRVDKRVRKFEGHKDDEEEEEEESRKKQRV